MIELFISKLNLKSIVEGIKLSLNNRTTTNIMRCPFANK